MRIVDEDKWAILTIAGEALGEPLEGKIAVGEVIRNRMKRGYASDKTVVGTVLAPKQFSMWDDRARLLAARADDVTPRVADCVKAWLASAKTNTVDGAVLYHTVQMGLPWWATRPGVTKVAQVGNHVFYRDSGGA